MGKRTIYQLGLITCLLSSCASKRTYYSFGSLAVTRIDYLDRSVFVYGKTDRVNDTNKYFEVSYNDMTDGIDMYLVFKKDKAAIEVIPDGLGKYNFQNADSCFINKYYPNPNFGKVIDSFKHDRSVGIIRISNSKELEKEWFMKDRPRVKVSSQ